jgi:hypothetical protein
MHSFIFALVGVVESGIPFISKQGDVILIMSS